MKKGIIFLLFVLIGSYAFGQRGNRPSAEERAQRDTEWMIADLELSEEQVSLVDSLNLLYAKTSDEMIGAIRESGDFQAMREKMGELNSSKDEELKTVLTEEQFEKYLKKVTEMRSQRRRG